MPANFLSLIASIPPILLSLTCPPAAEEAPALWDRLDLGSAPYF